MYRQFYRPLPRDTHPTGTRCIQLTIPDSDDYERALYAQATELTMWLLWERDADKQGTVVAKQWREALKTWGYCDGRTSPVVGESDYEMSLCEQLRWHDGILQALCCGVWQDIPGQSGVVPPGGRNPEGEGRPGAGGCNEFEVTLKAGDTWLLPIPVQTGDTLEITNVQGIWSDSAGIFWQYGNGDFYALGQRLPQCDHKSSDPSASICHMGLMAQIGDTTYLSAYDTSITVPTISSSQNLKLLANNGFPNPMGNITFHVKWCSGATPPTATWCYVFDFATSKFDWTDILSPKNAVWVSGEGWDSVVTSSPAGTYLQIGYQFVSTVNITHYRVEYTANAPFATSGSGFGIGDSLIAIANLVAFTVPSVGDNVSEGNANWDINQLGLYIQLNPTDGVTTTTARISRVILKGTGVNPFGGNNC